MKTFRLAFFFMLTLLLGTAVIHSLVAQFDDSFGTGGIVTTSGFNTAVRMAVQDDGKIVVAAQSGTLLRYLANGVLDDTFGTNGIAEMEITDDWRNTLYISDLIVTDFIVLSSGKLLVVGYTTTGDFTMNTPDIIVIRYLSDGTVDTTFAHNGLARIHVNGVDHAYAVVERADGKLIVVGDSRIQFNDPSPVVLRLLENGSIDPTFGTNGATQTLIGTLGNLFHVTLQSDNKIVASGTAIIGGKPNAFVIRYTEAGTVDTTFSGDGYASLNLGTNNTLGYDVALVNNQELLLSGTFNNGSDNDLFLAKLDSSGNLVTTFGVNGVATADFGNMNTYRGEMIIDSLNRAVVTGTSDSHIYVARYSSSGALDTSFETNGFLSIPISTSSSGMDVRVQPADNKVLVLGNSSEGIVLARLNENLSTVYMPFVVR
jgi:uncharacterized delta-60 repeat protein